MPRLARAAVTCDSWFGLLTLIAPPPRFTWRASNYVDAYEDHFLSEVGPTVLGSLVAQIKTAITPEEQR